ncbi:MAG: MucB/RseB C-terminal domain-containing protein [Casimicrobiaceae bacterium]|nr:MucB/RseB C-terminal domain-containing protein [Casimicrobiaceae bacterium]MDW8312376.1 MucB/RseB C-terminal domain-containing protein [Burkholderiales bacterium]
MKILARSLGSAPVWLLGLWSAWLAPPLALLVSAQALAQSNPASAAGPIVPSSVVSQLLAQAAQAAATLNYTGTIVYTRRGVSETSRIVHLYENGIEMERIVTLDGPPVEVVRVNDELTCYLPDSKVKRIEPRTGRQGFPALLPRQQSTLAQYFTVRRLEIERVAGHEAQVWLFEPNDEYRFWHKLWTELKTGLWLRGRVLDERGQVIEEITFTDLTIGGRIDRELVKPTLANKIAQWRIDRSAPSALTRSESPWLLRGLPPGFVKVRESTLRSLPGRSEPVTHILVSDGLSSVSVYASSALPGEQIPTGPSVQGVHHVFARQAGDQIITAFGDARPAAVRAIAHAVTRR